jgi:vacuolar-type H+-ATPase subunit E/Vma4
MSQVRVVLKSVYDDKGMKNASKSFDNIGKSVLKIGGLIAAAFSVRALGDFAKAAAEDAKSAALLEQQLKNTVGANDALVASVEDSIREMQMSAAVADDVLRPAFGQLVRATGDVTQATRLMDIALDVSAATGRDVNAVAIALSRAYQGNTTALSRLGIKAQEGVDVFAMLEEQFAGAAETAARNDPFQRLTIIFGELQEQIGQNFLPLLNDVADYFASAEFSDAFRELAINVGLAIEQIDGLFKQVTGTNALTSFVNFFSGVAYEVAKLGILFDALGKSAGLWFSGQWLKAATFDPAAYIREQIRKLDQEIAKRRGATSSPAARGGAFSALPTMTGVGGRGGARTSGPTAFEQTQKIIQNAQKKLREAQAKYSEAIAAARSAYDKAIVEAEKLYQETLTEATKRRDESLSEALKAHAKNVAGIQRDFAQRQADIIQQSIDRLRDAYSQAIRANVADLFGTEAVGKSIDKLITNLRDRLTASRTLVANTALLASQGFSQTFLEQIVGSGLETGNELSKAILEATPETQRELQSLFGALESESETGMDSLAKTIFDKTGLATTELKKLFAQTQTDLVEALKQAQTDYSEAQAEILKSFDETMTEATTRRDEAFAKALSSMNEALTEAKDQYLETVRAIREAFEEEIKNLEGKLGGLGATVRQLLALLAGLQGGEIKIPTVTTPTFPTTVTPPIITPQPVRTQPVVVINNNVKVDPTQSPSMTGAAISKAINKYIGGGGGLNRGIAAV